MTGSASRPGLSRSLLKLARLVAVLFVVSVLCFLSLELLPGSPARMLLGDTAPQEAVDALNVSLGLDRPLATRYVDWIGDVVRGDFGQSFATGQPVWKMITQRAPISLELIALSQIFALIAAVPLAALAAARRGRPIDKVLSVGVFVALSVPSFVFSFLLIWVVAVKLHWLPANGFQYLTRDPVRHIKTLILPALALSVGPFALYQRVFRADLIETYDQEFMHVARAKGLSPTRIALRHAFRPSLLGLTTSVGVVVGSLIGASVIVETIFSIPGLGSALVGSVNSRDYFVVQGLVLVIATAVVVINAIVDVLYGVIDPRIRATRARQGRASRRAPAGTAVAPGAPVSGDPA